MKGYSSKKSQAGEGELATFGLAVLACALLSGAIFAFNWVKDTKNGRLDARRQAAIDKLKSKDKISVNKDPDAYYVSCKKSLWQALQKNAPCEISPYSYGELEFLTYEYD
jgi:hypothetical protein